MASIADGLARGRARCSRRARADRRSRALTVDAELAGALRDAAYLEGDFVLRSGKRSSYYLDKYRFRRGPTCWRRSASAIAAAVAEHEPEAVRLARPSSAPCRSPPRPRSQSGLRS